MVLIDLNSPKEIIQLIFSSHPPWGLNENIANIEKAGEGNMNMVLRITFVSGHSIILKQSRPYVNKYPSIPAPIHRIDVERAFYQTIAQDDNLRGKMPVCIGYDAEACLMLLEDLGAGSDYTFLYKKESIDQDFPGDQALLYLSRLHHLEIPGTFPSNMELRLLNAEHLFEYPYQINIGFDLDLIQPGLQSIAQPFKENESLKRVIQRLKSDYLSSGSCLIHGDFYPGSWLHTHQGFKVIDPEFSFIGNPAYDLGILVANFKIARRSDQWLNNLILSYDPPLEFNMNHMWPIACMEVIRRLIGLAQLPTDLSLDEKKIMLDWAHDLLR